MFNQILGRVLAITVLSVVAVPSVLAQADSRGSMLVYPVIFDETGTDGSRAKAQDALTEIFKKGGFKVVDDSKAGSVWKAKGFRTPTITRPPTVQQLVALGKTVGVRYVCTTSVTFHTRSIWVNLGPKTISTCNMTVTIVDAKAGKVAYEAEGEARSDEKSDKLKVAGALLLTPLVTAVSGGPKTPQESRAAQIAAAHALEKFVVVQ
ncbi:MAG: hypothetical protein KIT11_00965 [Fimbriimonadaceae bacterium]|nr:hypothetical protein [Fimbriimonadaceae bacterium]QYK55056.1 MAG: hypothetical protein KF733_08570 [Fimbriimonadaceae bacterium]